MRGWSGGHLDDDRLDGEFAALVTEVALQLPDIGFHLHNPKFVFAAFLVFGQFYG